MMADRPLPTAHRLVDFMLLSASLSLDLTRGLPENEQMQVTGVIFANLRRQIFRILDAHADNVRSEILGDARTPETPQ